MFGLFKKKPKDWLTVWTENANWTISGMYAWGETYKTTERCAYMIQYSKSRNRYRVKTIGHRPKDHQVYFKIVLPKLTEFESKLLENGNSGSSTKSN